MTLPPDHPSASPPLDSLLNRPADQRVREYKYRFAQSVVFGLPVVALEAFGHHLGGPDPARWVGIFQAVLAGWVLYVGAAGMLFEGLLLLRRRFTPDLPVALLAVALYLLSLVGLSHTLVTRTPHPRLFHLCVLVVGIWTGVQWYRGSRRLRTGSAGHFSDSIRSTPAR